MAEQSKGRFMIIFIGTASSGRSDFDVIRRTFHDFDSSWTAESGIFLEVAQQDSDLFRRSSQRSESYSPLLPLTATQTKYVNFDFDEKPLLRHLLFSADTMKTAHLELSASVIKTWLNKSAEAMYIEHRENFVVQYAQNQRSVFIDALRLFTRRICAVRTTVLKSLRIGKKSLRICERSRKKPLLHLANRIKCLWNDSWGEGVRRESGGQLIPVF